MASVRSFAALVLACAMIFLPPASVLAGPASDALGQCLVGKTTGDERLLMVRWMTLGFASHPAVHDAVTVDASKLDITNREVAKLVTDLLTNRCAQQTKAAVAESKNPGIAIQAAFQALGGAAAQEVLMAPDVTAKLEGFSAYLDNKALETVLQPQ